jgi:hypothetical protein
MGYPYPTMLIEKAFLLKAPLHVDPAFVMGVGVAACTCQDQPRRFVCERKLEKSKENNATVPEPF